VTGGTVNASYEYNGQGDRVGQTVGGATTHYTLDLAAGLTQVLADGTNTYLYGLGRIGEYSNANGWRYYLGDSLGSVRQLTSAAGEVLLAKGYQPYGEVLNSAGSVSTSYGYTGEWTDGYIGLVNLRSRMYSPGTGRFLTRDNWRGDYFSPMSYNLWLYVNDGPIKYVDPAGRSPYCDSPYSDPNECEVSKTPPRSNLCDRNCMIDATKPLNTLSEINTLPNPTRALFMRLLLSEIGWRLIGNANWKTEGTALLWTVQNRVSWEQARVYQNDPLKKGRFKPCEKGYYPCAVESKQYYGLNQPRAKDPLYLKSANTKQKQASHYHDEKYVPIALERAFLVVTRFVSDVHDVNKDPSNIDRNGGAHYMSHQNSTAVFSRHVDHFCDNKYIESYREEVLRVPYVESIPILH
jgi:RHS repeat-associated protein